MGDSENRNVNCSIYNGGEKISLYLHAAVEKSGRLNFDEYCIDDVYYVTVNGGGLQVMNVCSFSQKHLRCLGSRLVALAAGERD